MCTFCMFQASYASKLPDDVWKYVKSNLPDAKQRFDSVITLSDDIMYIPLYPAASQDVEKIAIEYSYPSSQSLKQLPEVILLNNGYSLLKVFKDNTGNYTLTKKDDLPIKVRLGLMPQDMLTPVGLKMPESLKLTLGDLLIPSKDETSLTKIEDTQKNNYSPAVKRNEFIPSVEFNNKKTFINPKNSKFLEVYDNTSPNPLYELKLSAMPQKIITNSAGDIALILYWNSKELDIVNLKDENIISKISVDDYVSDAVVNRKDNIAYVTSPSAYAIYMVDLNSAKLIKVVKLDQKPSKIAYCELDGSISFYDEFKEYIYNVTQNDVDFIVQEIGEIKNLSKILSDVANIYAISRTKNELLIFDKTQGKLISTVELDKKPTDAIRIGTKILILCSKEGYLDIYDTVQNKIIAKQELSKEDFYSKITPLPNEKNVIITGLNAKNYVIFNYETQKLVKKQESYIDVSNIVILNKGQKL